MTREEARKAAEVMMAYADGKEIEFLSIMDKWSIIQDPTFNWHSFNYRIKKEPTYRPFKNKEECWAEMQKHQPFGWVKTIYKSYCLITYVKEYVLNGDDSVEIDSISYSLKEAFKQFTFVDGTPFGIKEDE